NSLDERAIYGLAQEPRGGQQGARPAAHPARQRWRRGRKHRAAQSSNRKPRNQQRAVARGAEFARGTVGEARGSDGGNKERPRSGRKARKRPSRRSRGLAGGAGRSSPRRNRSNRRTKPSSLRQRSR
ncbi:unnamed protein product, partial [Laminaria digitata]